MDDDFLESKQIQYKDTEGLFRRIDASLPCFVKTEGKMGKTQRNDSLKENETPAILSEGAILIGRSNYKALRGDAPPAPGVFVIDDDEFENKTPSELNELLMSLVRSAK